MSKRKKTAISFVLATSFCLLIALFYMMTPPALTLGNSVRYTYTARGYESDGKLEIANDSENYHKIQEWLRKRRVWYPDLNSYVYVDRIASDRMTINVMDNRVVVNMIDGSGVKWTQFTCAVDEEIRGLAVSLHESLKTKIERDRVNP